MAFLKGHYELKVRGVLGGGGPGRERCGAESEVVMEMQRNEVVTSVCGEWGAGDQPKGWDKPFAQEVGAQDEGEIPPGGPGRWSRPP